MTTQGISFPILFLALAAVFPAAAQEGERFDLEQLRSLETTVQLRRKAARLEVTTRRELDAIQGSGDSRAINEIAGRLDILDYTDDRLATLLEGAPSTREIVESNAYGQRILAGVEEPVEGELFPSVPALFANTVLGGIFGFEVPGLSERKQHRPLGESRARLESPLLHEEGRDDFFSVEELADLTPEEVSRVDISPDHPNWYDRESWKDIRPRALDHFEDIIEDGITRSLREQGSTSDYELEQAQKVLFLDYIFHAATTPKGQVQDAFGGLWKIKWGPEASIASVTTRLYLLAGARMTNVILTNGTGPAAMTLVLADPEEAATQKPSPKLAYPTTVDELVSAIQGFYEFDLRPYLHSQGTITAANVDSVLRNLPEGAKPEFRKNQLIGRTWVAFKESSIELNTDGFIRHGDGLRLSDPLAVHDRVARASFLFDMWVGNRDVKDANSDTYFLMDRPGEVYAYREGRSDQGMTLGSLTAPGDINKFDTGRKFARRGLFGNLRFHQSIIFEPEAYKAITWADGKWMARHLADISDDDIRRAVSASAWPDFAQEALAYRLLDRRDRIAKLFGIDPGPEIPAPSMAIALGTPGQIRAAEERYGLPPGSLADELAGVKVDPDYTEVVLEDGIITSGLDSALVRALTRHAYPSGLASRYQLGKPPKCLR